MFKYFILLAFIIVGFNSFAQIKQDEENVLVKANRTVPEAYRIIESPKIIDTVIPQSEVEYPLLSLKIIALIHWHAFLLWLRRVPFLRKSDRTEVQLDVMRPHSTLKNHEHSLTERADG